VPLFQAFSRIVLLVEQLLVIASACCYRFTHSRLLGVSLSPPMALGFGHRRSDLFLVTRSQLVGALSPGAHRVSHLHRSQRSVFGGRRGSGLVFPRLSLRVAAGWGASFAITAMRPPFPP